MGGMMRKEKQTIESIEAALSTARAEIGSTQDKLADAIAREKQLSEKRAPLLRDAKIRGDQKAQDLLDRLTAQRFSALQEIDDLRSTIEILQSDVIELQRQHEQAQRQQKVETLRVLKAQRGRVAEQIESLTKQLNGELIGYGKLADEIVTLGYDLQLGNLSTRGMLGVPLVRDFVQRHLQSLFPNLTSSGDKFSLSELENQTTAAIEHELRAAERKEA